MRSTMITNIRNSGHSKWNQVSVILFVLGDDESDDDWCFMATFVHMVG